MHILFGWGDNPSTSDMPYRVLTFNTNFMSESGDTMISNCQPTHISMTIELPDRANPGQEFFNFATDQHNQAAENGKGKISVFAGRDVGESLLEVRFENGWVDSIDMNVSETDDKFLMTVLIAAASVTISETEFTHHRRAEHFS